MLLLGQTWPTTKTFDEKAAIITSGPRRSYQKKTSRTFCKNTMMTQQPECVVEMPIAAFLANHQTAQVHKEVSSAPITRPAVLTKEGQFAVDLTWLKRTDPANPGGDLKNSQILFAEQDWANSGEGHAVGDR